MADSPWQRWLKRLFRAIPLLLPVLFFLALRLAILETALDRLGHLGEGELAHANLAADLLEHRPLRPLMDYQVVNFHGGTLISSLLYVPWSWIFGVSYASLKGLALGYAVAAMLLWMMMLGQWRGRGAAMLFGWLYACAPPVLTRMQLTLWGTHAELNALLAFCLLLAFRWTRAGEEAQRGRRLFLTGLIAGLSIYFNYSAAVFVGLLGLISLVRTRGVGRLIFPAGVFAGLLPLMGSMMEGRGQLEVYGQTPVALLDGAISRLPDLPALLLRVPPFSPQMPPVAGVTVFGAVVHLTFYGAAAALLVRALRKAIRQGTTGRGPEPDSGPSQGKTGGAEDSLLEVLIGAYPFIFLVVFTAVHLPFTTSTDGAFGFGARYAATLYPFLMAALACVAGEAFRSSDASSRFRPEFVSARLALLMALLIGATGLRDDLHLIDPATPHMAARFDPIPWTRQDIWSADRLSMEGVERFLALEAAGRLSSETARGVRAVIGEAFNTDYWRLLWQPDDGPALESLEARVRQARAQPGSSAYQSGVAWGRAIAVGQPYPATDGPVR